MCVEGRHREDDEDHYEGHEHVHPYQIPDSQPRSHNDVQSVRAASVSRGSAMSQRQIVPNNVPDSHNSVHSRGEDAVSAQQQIEEEHDVMYLRMRAEADFPPPMDPNSNPTSSMAKREMKANAKLDQRMN